LTHAEVIGAGCPQSDHETAQGDSQH
jgi:hypothetical protein